MLRLSVFGQLKERKGHRKVNIFTEDTYSKQGQARHRFIGSPLMYKSITLDYVCMITLITVPDLGYNHHNRVVFTSTYSLSNTGQFCVLKRSSCSI